MKKHFLWKGIMRLQTNVFPNLESLQTLTKLSQEESLRYQRNKVVELLKYSFEHVPYYRSCFRNLGVKNEDSIVYEHLFELPVLTKQVIRNHFDDLQSKDKSGGRTYINTSGGSTGEPVSFVQDQNFTDWKRAIKLLNDEWTGYLPGMPKVTLWGSERDIQKGGESLFDRIKLWSKNEHLINSFKLNDEKKYRYVEFINKVRPVQVLAYVESIFELAIFIQEHNLQVHSPKAIMTSAGTLYPEMRSLIESVFRTKVFNRYGSREVGDIACQYSQDNHNLMISLPTHYIEILGADNRPLGYDEPGEVVVTSFINNSMPLIRYKIGDVASFRWNDTNWPVLSQIKGRTTDSFINSTGDTIYGEYFTHLLYHKGWVKKFQIVQKTTKLIQIKLVINNRPDQESMNEVEEGVKKVMSEDCKVEFLFVDKIAPSKSGKYRYTISEVDQ